MSTDRKNVDKLIQENWRRYLDEVAAQNEHRGIPCEKKQGKERRECEAQAEEAKERSQEKHRKKRKYSSNDEELEALGRGKVYSSKPALKTRKNQVNPDELTRTPKAPELKEKKSKQKKKTCTSRADGRGMNRYHDSRGRLTTKANAKSSSVRASTNQPCKYDGTARMPGEKITKRPCGRLDRLNPNVKAKYLCKSGKRISELLVNEDLNTTEIQMFDADDWIVVRKDAFDSMVIDIMMDTLEELKDELVDYKMPIKENNQALVQKCQAAGLRTFPQFLEAFNNLMLSSKGELHKEKK